MLNLLEYLVLVCLHSDWSSEGYSVWLFLAIVMVRPSISTASLQPIMAALMLRQASSFLLEIKIL